MIELMKPKLTFTQSEIQDGDIICFQVDISEKELVFIFKVIVMGFSDYVSGSMTSKTRVSTRIRRNTTTSCKTVS